MGAPRGMLAHMEVQDSLGWAHVGHVLAVLAHTMASCVHPHGTGDSLQKETPTQQSYILGTTVLQ